MASIRRSGQTPLKFTHCADLRVVPSRALAFEEHLHGGFAVDRRAGRGEIYYGMPGCGIMRVSADLTSQEILDLPPTLRPLNFHSTKIGEFNGDASLFMPSNDGSLVAVLSLDGELKRTLSRPEFDEYRDEEVAYIPTDTIPRANNRLIVTDGYGANYISTVDAAASQWTETFGGKTTDPEEHGKFGTAHGMNPTPAGDRIAIADRPHSRLELYTFGGNFQASYPLPSGSRPCGIDFIEWQGQHLAAIASLDDPDTSRPAPIYILDGSSFEVLSTIRPKEELGIELADHMHNVILHELDGELYLICQAWQPGHYFVLKLQA